MFSGYLWLYFAHTHIENLFYNTRVHTHPIGLPIHSTFVFRKMKDIQCIQCSLTGMTTKITYYKMPKMAYIKMFLYMIL